MFWSVYWIATTDENPKTIYQCVYKSYANQFVNWPRKPLYFANATHEWMFVEYVIFVPRIPGTIKTIALRMPLVYMILHHEARCIVFLFHSQN